MKKIICLFEKNMKIGLFVMKSCILEEIENKGEMCVESSRYIPNLQSYVVGETTITTSIWAPSIILD